MANFAVHPEGTAVSIDPGRVIRIGKASSDDEGDDPSVVVTLDGTFAVEESIRTIEARFGGAVALRGYQDAAIERPAAFALARVAALTKDAEERDEDDPDPTLVHLTNGEVLRVGESIRTLTAALSLQAGIRVLEVNVVDTSRPAAIVPDKVRAVLRHSDAREGEPGCLVAMEGGAGFACAEDPDRMMRLVEREIAAQARDAEERAAPAAGGPTP